jgi:hypothetical protein
VGVAFGLKGGVNGGVGFGIGRSYKTWVSSASLRAPRVFERGQEALQKTIPQNAKVQFLEVHISGIK